MKHLEMTVRDIVLAALEAAAGALGVSLAAGASLTKATLVAAGIIGLRAGLGVIANLRAQGPITQ